MAIEIRELVIKATVTDQSQPEMVQTSMSAREKEELIATCLERVREILNDKNER